MHFCLIFQHEAGFQLQCWGYEESMSVSQLLEEAQKLLAQKAYREAHARCLTVLQQDPKNHFAYYLLGILTADHANHLKAVELFDRALGFAPDHAPSHAQKARSLLTLNRREAALDAVKRASQIKDLAPFTLDTLGVVLSRAGRHQEAIPFYQKAVAGAPEQPEYFYNYGAALQFMGKMAEAREAYKKVIALDPLDARARAAIVTITKQNADENDIAELEALFPRFKQDANASLNIGHAIAKDVLEATADWREQMTDAGMASSDIALLERCFALRDVVERWHAKSAA